jgi:ankyrin repeat protein
MKYLVDGCSYDLNRYYHCALDSDFEGRVNRLGLGKKSKRIQGISPLHVACINPSIKVFKMFFAVVPDMSVNDSNSRKLIHFAAANKSPDILEFLITKGAQINELGRT